MHIKQLRLKVKHAERGASQSCVTWMYHIMCHADLPARFASVAAAQQVMDEMAEVTVSSQPLFRGATSVSQTCIVSAGQSDANLASSLSFLAAAASINDCTVFGNNARNTASADNSVSKAADTQMHHKINGDAKLLSNGGITTASISSKQHPPQHSANNGGDAASNDDVNSTSQTPHSRHSHHRGATAATMPRGSDLGNKLPSDEGGAAVAAGRDTFFANGLRQRRRLTLPDIVLADGNTSSPAATDSGGSTKVMVAARAHTNHVIRPSQSRPSSLLIVDGVRHTIQSDERAASLNIELEEDDINATPHYRFEPLDSKRKSLRGSLPDVGGGDDESDAATGRGLSREEVHELGEKRREELRLLQEREDKRRKWQLVISFALIQVRMIPDIYLYYNRN